ncbi:MAG: tetratricopeptide repeat protein, partial [Gemmatimonadota bacterium]|nr:tetratricopeptide repeat protein [Gemmatimonadota bacterium]
LASPITVLGDYDRAVGLLDSAYAEKSGRLGPDHAEAIVTLARSTRPLVESGQIDLAESRLWSLYDRTSAEGIYRIEVLDLMGQARRRAGDPDSATVLLRESVEMGEARLRDNHRILNEARRNLAAVLIERGETAEATEILATVLEVELATRPSPHYRIGATYVLLAKIELARGADAEGERLLQAALAEFRELPRDHWRVQEVRRLLESVDRAVSPSGDGGRLLLP